MSEPLTPAEFEELDRLFQQAVLLHGKERAALVDAVRAGSAPLAAQLLAMLDQDAAGSSVVERVVAAGAGAVMADDQAVIGERFGPYRIERVIGRGGMGAVYLCSRADDEFHQTVAIKTIRAGLESEDALKRFRREREILARLNHPGIARLLDGGTGPRGTPFVAMEFVEGVPLARYAKEHRLGIRPRLQLFLELCDAVAFVHRSLVVHRDIKPANVLVTSAARVKLLDFGIAKLSDEFEGGTAQTSTMDGAMTPEYASPEQIQGRPVTIATDVYALGVLLYELLTGERPVRFDSTRPFELAQEIVSRTPDPPSDAVRRGRDRAGLPEPAAKAARQLTGDLDRIVMMAMRKEPERRYGSVAALAADVSAWLAGRPVTAHRDSWRYRVRKFVGRHPWSSAAAVLFLAVVAGFTALTAWQGRLIRDERDNAVVAERRAAANAAFLTRLFTTADPRRAGNRNMTALDLLQTGVAQIGTDQSLDPRVRADLYLTLGLALANLGNFEPGIAALRRSVEESERVYGRDSLETAERLHRLGDILRQADQIDEGYAKLTEALEIRRRHITGETYEIADSYNNLSIVAIVTGRYREADELQAESVAMHRRLTGDRSQEIAVPLNNLSLLRRRQGRLPEALNLATQSYEILRNGDDKSSMLRSRNNAVSIRVEMGDLRDAESSYGEILDAFRVLVGPTHSHVLESERHLLYAKYLKGQYDEVARRAEDLERRTQEALGARSAAAAMVSHLRGLIDRDLGDLASAEARLRTALEVHVETTGPRHFRIPVYRCDLAEVLMDRGRLPEAEQQIREALALLPDARTFPHIERGRALLSLARALTLQRRMTEAEEALREARGIIAATTGEGGLDDGRLLLEQGRLARAKGDETGASEFLAGSPFRAGIELGPAFGPVCNEECDESDIRWRHAREVQAAAPGACGRTPHHHRTFVRPDDRREARSGDRAFDTCRCRAGGLRQRGVEASHARGTRPRRTGIAKYRRGHVRDLSQL
jgi:eukaryotic-like serine/threonine-protein kinase